MTILSAKSFNSPVTHALSTLILYVSGLPTIIAPALILLTNAELEKVELDIKDFEGNQVKDWYFYKDENGEKGEYLCSKSEGEYLEAGKKYWIDVKFDDSSFVTTVPLICCISMSL